MEGKKIIIIALILFLILLSISGIVIKNRLRTQVKELFRMNKDLQEEGYYMAEFEFKMLGIAYYLDKAHYYYAVSRLDQLHKQLKFKQNLIKVPEFKSKEDEMEFYLNLQNPETGAFMDDSYPYCTYNEPTENVLSHLAALAKETLKPLCLKYDLKYLDEIKTPDKLTAFLDDVSSVGWIASKFPQTSFVFARSLLGFCNEEGIIGTNNLYNFSPEWKQAILHWFYENQDSETGFWGPKSKINGRLLKKDMTNTASIIKTFVDKNGSNIHASFPLRYKNEMFSTALELLSESSPPDNDPDELHEWNLIMEKGIKMLLRYLWKDALQENKEYARKLIETYVKIKFEKYYISGEGAFSYYPGAEHAALDGTGGFFIFRDIGAFSGEKQKQLWGTSKMKHWINTISQTMGNWVSKEQIRQELESLEIEKVPVYEEDFPLENANEVLQRNNELVVIGFDVLQIPRYKIVYKYSSE